MKHLSVILYVLFLAACKKESPVINEVPITHENLVSLEYGIYGGFDGSVVKITVYPQNQVFKPLLNSPKTCEVAVSEMEWRGLAQLFDENEAKKVNRNKPSECVDAGGQWIIARSVDREITIRWGDCTNGDISNVQSLVRAMVERMRVARTTCR